MFWRARFKEFFQGQAAGRTLGIKDHALLCVLALRGTGKGEDAESESWHFPVSNLSRGLCNGHTSFTLHVPHPVVWFPHSKEWSQNLHDIEINLVPSPCSHFLVRVLCITVERPTMHRINNIEIVLRPELKKQRQGHKIARCCKL